MHKQSKGEVLDMFKYLVNTLVYCLVQVGADHEQWRTQSNVREVVERLIRYLNDNIPENEKHLHFVLEIKEK